MRSSASRPVSGASSPSTRCAPPTADSTRTARHSRCGSALPFRVCSPASANAIALPVSRWVGTSASTDPGSAAAWTRDAVFTASPATIPSPTARRFTATSPVTTPARAARPGSPDSAPSSATAATRSSAARTARSASPSVATGVPQTAMTASPMNFSTTPPYRPITVRATPKYADNSSRTASGSRASDSGVNPTTLQNSTEHIRRSAADSRAGGKAGAGAGAASKRVAPHRRQKRFPGVSGSPQVGQPPPTGAPQSPQKRSPSAKGAPHRPHPNPDPPRSARQPGQACT